jgi:hypothetical protein
LSFLAWLIEAAWKLPGSCLEAAWKLPGSYMEAAVKGGAVDLPSVAYFERTWCCC